MVCGNSSRHNRRFSIKWMDWIGWMGWYRGGLVHSAPCDCRFNKLLNFCLISGSTGVKSQGMGGKGSRGYSPLALHCSVLAKQTGLGRQFLITDDQQLITILAKQTGVLSMQ